MPTWLQSIDTSLFRFINLRLNSSFLDQFMPSLAGNAWFIPLAVLLGIFLLWKGGMRGRLFVIVLVLVLAAGDGLVINRVKKLVARPRPHATVPDARLLVGKGDSASMPSSHSSTWFAATLVAFVYYRRTWRVLLPLACLMGFSRVYLGAHYPGDVLVGAVLGAGYAAAGLWALENFWQRFGRSWFPLWWSKVPSLIAPGRPVPTTTEAITPSPQAADAQFLSLSYAVITVLFLARLLYLSADIIDLSEDEAYQWIWSKNLALFHFSEPLLIAVTQFLGTRIWGDTELGVRFFSPVLGALGCLVAVRFMAREVSARAGFFLLLILTCTPMVAAGTLLMTVDPLLVFFGAVAMFAGWRAVQPDGAMRHWIVVGLFTGLGFFSKHTAACQWIGWVMFFILWPPARVQLRRPGPWVALGIFVLFTLPVLVWSQQHGGITAPALAENGQVDNEWHPTLRYLGEFTVAEVLLLHPVFFLATLWALGAFWKTRRQHPLLLYFFAMGVPLFLGCWLYTFRAPVHPNWIAASVMPLFCLMVTYWHGRWRAGARPVRAWLIAGLASGALMVILLLDTNLIFRIARVRLPARLDPTARVRGMNEMARVVKVARDKLRAEGKEVFILATDHGMTGELSFYLPEARPGLPGNPLVYVRLTGEPLNQFYFWPQYRYPELRKGQNAIFVMEVLGPDQPPQGVQEQFQSVTDLGLFPIQARKQPIRQVQLFACRNLL